VGVGEGDGVVHGVGVGEGVGVSCGDTFQSHVCMMVPFSFVVIADTFQLPTAGLVFVYDASVTLSFV
jgi:hypothetical protein